MVEKYNITVLGGDMRQTYLTEILLKNNCQIAAYGLSTSKCFSFNDSINFIPADSLLNALKSSDIILGPIPVTKDSVHIFSMVESSCFKQEDFTIELFKKHMNRNKFFLGGAIPKSLTEYFDSRQIPYYDLMKDETIALQNAVATAEGTIMEAIRHSSCNLHKSRCLVLGFGRCATILAKKLSGLDAQVTICARKQSALILADCFAYHALPFEKLADQIAGFDYIFNTIPSPILTKEILCRIPSDTTIIDIASAPGGLDYTYVEEHEQNAHLCLGLPGKLSPKTSASILADKILTILKVRGEYSENGC